MKQTLKHQAKRSALALAAVGAFAAFGTVLAAPPAGGPAFTKASITIAPRTSEANELTAGDLNCSFTETGLGAFAQVSYECKAAAVGVVEACVFKNKIISATQLSVFKNVSSVEGGEGGGGEGSVLLAKSNGTITGTVVAAIPEAGEGGGGEGNLCPELGEVNGPEPAVEVVAVRWCNASLTDTTHNLVGATVGELFQEFFPGSTVPSCAVLLATP